MREKRLVWRTVGLFLFSSVLAATTIPRLTFEQLTDASDLIVSGRITQSWAAWDTEHKYIWTHYLLSVSDTARGVAVPTVEFAEPGGIVGDQSMLVAGSVTYQIGSDVAIFLSRMPNGYLRTAGWSQGKYAVDDKGRLHGASLTSLDGVTLSELKQRVAARTRAAAGSRAQ